MVKAANSSFRPSVAAQSVGRSDCEQSSCLFGKPRNRASRISRRCWLPLLVAASVCVSGLMATALSPLADRPVRDYSHFRDSRDTLSALSRLHGVSRFLPESTGLGQDGPFVLDSQNMRCVGRWPFGPCQRLSLSDHVSTDHLLFLGAGYGVRILNVANPALPTTVGKVDVLGNMEAGGIVKKDTLLYVLSTHHGLEIFSIANLASPRKLGEYLLTSWNNDLAVKDSFAYTVGLDMMVHVISVADPSRCQEIAAYGPLTDYTDGCCIQGSVLYVAAQSAGLIALDISDPHHPAVLGTLPGLACVKVVVDSNYAYLVGGGCGVLVVSVANPRSMNVVGQLSSVPAGAFCKCGFLLYTVNEESYSVRFSVVDVSQPSWPTLVSDTTAVGWGGAVTGVGMFGYAYTADDWGGFHVIDARDPIHLVVDTVLFRADATMGLAVSRGYAILAEDMSSVPIIDVHSPSMPYEVGAYDTNKLMPWRTSVVIRDTLAYACGLWLSVINFTDPAHPFLVARPTFIDRDVLDMSAMDSLLFVGEDGEFTVFDISDPAHLRATDSFSLGMRGVSDVEADGNRVYVSIPYSALRIYDCSNPDSLRLVGQIYGDHNQYAFASAARDSVLYAGVNGVGIVAYDVSDPSNPYVIGEDTNWAVLNFSDVALWGDKLVVSSWGYIRVLDISDPTNMREVGHYQPIGGLAGIAVDSSHIYAACGDGGLSILELLPSGIAENTVNTGYAALRGGQSVVRGVLEIPEAISNKPQAASFLLDIAGRKVQDLHPGPNDVSRLAAGVYFVSDSRSGQRVVHKVVIQR